MDAAALDELLERAAGTALTRGAVTAFAASASATELRASFDVALERRGARAASVIAFALASVGERLPAKPLIALLADLGSIEHLPPLVACAEGDRVALLLELVESGRASWEREAMALFLATRLLEGRPPPSVLTSRLRSLAREPLGIEARTVVGLAMRDLGDPSLAVFTAQTLGTGLPSGHAKLAAGWTAALARPPLNALPEREPPRVVSGYTVVRTTPKVGRNDPCPCGSGKKFKRCCALDEQRRADDSPADQLARLGGGNARLREQLVAQLRPAELARQDPARLGTKELILAIRRLSTHRRWDDVSRFAGELDHRTDLPSGYRDYHLEIADEALAAGAFDAAQRHFERADPSPADREKIEVELALARKSPDALERLETLLESALKADDELRVIECAHALLESFPALGILAARGSLFPGRELDAEVLLEEIDRARDRLLLDPYEPWWGLVDVLTSQENRHGDGSTVELEPAEDDIRARREVERLRSAQREAEDRAASLQAELERRSAELTRSSAELERLAQAVETMRQDDTVARASELETECRRLRRNVDELEHAVAVGAEQRAELRRELRRAISSSPSARPSHAESDPPSEERVDDDELPGEAAVPSRIRLPRWTARATKAFGELPGSVASHGLRVVGSLAAGDSFAWAGVKRMRSAAGLYSARVGRSHRVLFRVADDSLEVDDLVARKNLVTALRHR